MTEKEKMLSGQLYNALDKTLSAERHHARMLFQKINQLGEESIEGRKDLFKELLGKTTNNFWIEPPFYCDYGYNIELGNKVFFNFNCCILDVMPVKIGDNVFFGPHVQIYTATHPMEAKIRNSMLEFAKPITIGNDVWIGGGAIICPGVTIGNGVVVGTGAVVTKDIVDNVFVGGNPAKVIKQINN